LHPEKMGKQARHGPPVGLENAEMFPERNFTTHLKRENDPSFPKRVQVVAPNGARARSVRRA